MAETAMAFTGPAQAEIGIVQPITNVNASGSCLDASAQDDTTVICSIVTVA